MPKTKVDTLPCPHCGYPAWSQADLDSHLQFAHGEKKHDKVAQQVAKEVSEKKETVSVLENVQMAKPEEESKLPPGIFVPKPLPDFWVSERVGRELYIIAKLSSRGEQVNVKVLGPAGVGKTSLGWEFASANKRPCFEVHWGMYQEPGEVWGKDRLSMEKGTYYEQARYVDALETPNCVVILDEPKTLRFDGSGLWYDQDIQEITLKEVKNGS